MDLEASFPQDFEVYVWKRLISIFEETSPLLRSTRLGSLHETAPKIQQVQSTNTYTWESWASCMEYWINLMRVYLAPGSLNLEYVKHIWDVVQLVDNCFKQGQLVELPPDFLYWMKKC